MSEERRKDGDRRTEDDHRRQIKEHIPKVFDRREEDEKDRRSGTDRREQDKQ